MRTRLTTVLLVAGLVVFGAGGAYAASAQLGLASHGKKHHAKKHHKKKHHGKKHAAVTPKTQNQGSNGDSSAQTQYGTRPGKGCGDRNHVHTGPPGNPSNTACPPQSQHKSAGAKSKAKHHHGRSHARKHKKQHRHGHH